MNLGLWKALGNPMGEGLRSGGAAPVYTISGTVYDADGSTAVAGATVALGALTATSAANGTYTIADVPVGTSGSMTCTKTGYVWTANTVSAMSGNLTSQNYTNAWWAGAGAGASCVRAYAPKGAASLAASYVNLVSPGTGDATIPAWTAAPTWDATNGWKFNGTTQALSIGVIPVTGQSFVVKFDNGSGANIFTCGMYNGDNAQMGFLSNNALGRIYRNGGSAVIEGYITSGVICVAGQKGYYNGTKETTTIPAWSGTGIDFHVGGRNRDGSEDLYTVEYVQAFSYYNAILTDAQEAMIRAALP